MTDPYRTYEGYYCCVCRNSVAEATSMRHPSGVGSVQVCYSCIGKASFHSMELFFVWQNDIEVRPIRRCVSCTQPGFFRALFRTLLCKHDWDTTSEYDPGNPIDVPPFPRINYVSVCKCCDTRKEWSS